MNIYPVILAGGSGTRLWPLSREACPKQFLPLAGGLTPFQDTVRRLAPVRGVKPATVVTHHEHKFMVLDQMRALGQAPRRIYLEPCGRSTAPALAIAARDILREDPDALLLALPADHDIPDAAAFASAIDTGEAAAAAGRLVIFGLEPRWPETGYGYIERGEPLDGAPGCHEVASFVEKPELEIATRLVQTGRHSWNSGIFLFPAATYLAELERLAPELATAARIAADASAVDGETVRLDAHAFARCPALSIDFAVMERTRLAAVVPADFSWSDIGSWDALWDRAGKDAQGNAGEGDVRLLDVQDSYIRSSRRLVVGIGLKDVVVVETADAILVAARGATQKVREAVEQLRAEGRPEGLCHRKVDRPWGHYEDVDAGDRFRVKRITVAPGAKLSLQYHHHRAEHWVVVSGTARVTRGDEVILLSENQSIYIAVGELHRLENPGKVPLQLIEVQTGTYLGEDDIVRVQDDYQRIPAGKAA